MHIQFNSIHINIGYSRKSKPLGLGLGGIVDLPLEVVGWENFTPQFFLVLNPQHFLHLIKRGEFNFQTSQEWRLKLNQVYGHNVSAWLRCVHQSSTILSYCNVLYCGIAEGLLSRLQSLENAAACLVAGLGRREHTTPVLRLLRRVSSVCFTVIIIYFIMHTIIIANDNNSNSADRSHTEWAYRQGCSTRVQNLYSSSTRVPFF